MPAGRGFYPTDQQGALNYFNVVHRNFNPFLIQGALRTKPIFLYLVLRDLSQPRAGGFDPIVQTLQLEDFGGVINAMSWTGEFQPSPIKNPLVNASWSMSLYLASMDVLEPELAMLQGSASSQAVFDVIKARYTDFYQKLLDNIEEKIFGAPDNPLDMDGLKNAVDDGTNYQVYGNLDRSTYPLWSAVVMTLPSNAYPQGQEWFAIPYVINKYRATKKGEGPNIVLCSYETFHALCKSLTAMERIISATPDEISFTKGAGFTALNISGLWVIPLNRLSGGTAYFLNTNSFVFYIHPDYFLAQSNWAPLLPINVYGWRTAISFAGNFVCLKPWNNIKVTNMPTAL